MKSNFAKVALVLVSGLIAGATAFAQATPEQVPTVRMAGETGGEMMHAKRDISMNKHVSGNGAVHETKNPKIRFY